MFLSQYLGVILMRETLFQLRLTLARRQCSQSLVANGLASETLVAFLLSPLIRCNQRLARLPEGSTLSRVPKLALLG